jgi:hypothetical protein
MTHKSRGLKALYLDSDQKDIKRYYKWGKFPFAYSDTRDSLYILYNSCGISSHFSFFLL